MFIWGCKMNQYYRSIFSESLNTWVAVSEIKPAKAKPSAGSRIRIRGIPSVRFAMGAFMAAIVYAWGAPAWANCNYELLNSGVIKLNATAPDSELLCLASLNNALHYVSINAPTRVGNYNNDGATAPWSIAIGPDANASGEGAISLGTNVIANASNAVSIGRGSRANVPGGVALGAGSIADRPNNLTGYVPPGASSAQTSAIAATTIGALGAVSVGYPTATRHITYVAAGTADTDAVNVAQLKAINATASAGWNLQANGGPVTNIAPNATVNVVNGSNTTAVLTGSQLQVNVVSNPTFTGTVTAPTFVASGANPITISGAAGTIGGLTNTTFDPDATYTGGYAATQEQLAEVAGMASSPLTFAGDSGSAVERDLGETVNIVGGATGTLTNGNIGVVADGADTLTVKLAEDIDLGATGSVTIGNTLVNNSGLTITGGPSVTSEGIDAGGKIITNVDDGVNATDAVNVRQLNGAIGSFVSRIDAVDRNASAGTASAMAMAGMPQAFTPGKSMFAFGAGAYRGQSAFAVGVSTMTGNGKWVIKGSLSGDSRGNVGGAVGAGFQW